MVIICLCHVPGFITSTKPLLVINNISSYNNVGMLGRRGKGGEGDIEEWEKGGDREEAEGWRRR